MKALSYSETKLWYKNKDEYVRRYVLGQENEPTFDQMIGKIVHAALEEPRYPWLKQMREMKCRPKLVANAGIILRKMAPRLLPEREVVLVGTTRYKIKLLTIFDGLHRKEKRLQDYKTYGATDKGHEPWNQYIVNDHFQFSFYAWNWSLIFHSFFSDIEIDTINLGKGRVKVFHTARSMRDIEAVEHWAMEAIREMKHEKVWDKRLTRQQRMRLKQSKLGL